MYVCGDCEVVGVINSFRSYYGICLRRRERFEAFIVVRSQHLLTVFYQSDTIIITFLIK